MGVYDRINSVRRGLKWKYINEQIEGAYHGRMTDLKNGKTSLSARQLEQAATLLGTTTDYLSGKTDDPSTEEQKEQPPAQGWEPIDPVTRELYDMVDIASPEEREIILEVIKVIVKKSRDVSAETEE